MSQPTEPPAGRAPPGEEREHGRDREHRDREPRDREHRDREPGRGRWLDSIMPEIVRRVLAQGSEALNKEEIKDTVVAELFRKAVNKGGEVASSTEESVRRLLADLPLPNEVVERIVDRFDDYKADLLRLVKEEVRAFLDRIDIGHELQRMLTSLSFEITTEIRFIPNEKGIRPDVKAGARVKRTPTKKREQD